MELTPTMQNIVNLCTEFGGRILAAIAIYIIGRIIISKLLKLISKVPAVDKMDPTAHNYILNLIKGVLYVVLAVSIIAQLGVSMTSVITILASCGVAVGLALQGALGNLAGGLMLLIFRPFNVGDYVCAGGEEGVVKKISLIYTVLNTVDNKTVSIPNGGLMNANVVNFTAEDLRRVDLTFKAAGSEPIKKVQAVILDAIVKTDKALADPAPQVEPLAGVPGGLEYTVRVWGKTADYWDLYFALMRNIPTALGEAGVSGPSSPVTVTQ